MLGKEGGLEGENPRCESRRVLSLQEEGLRETSPLENHSRNIP